MIHTWIKITFYGCLVLLLAACGGMGTPTIPHETPTRPGSPSPVAATQTEPEPEVTQTEMSPTVQASPSSGLESLIEKAKDDLAQRLSISVDQISFVEAMEVEWSDSSLDCPQPGMAYLQVITPGYRILLDYAGNQYEYHSNRDTYVIYCENRIPPIIPSP